jgi:chorismate dehydratase
MPRTVGCVPFVNARPLIAQFGRDPGQVEVLLDVPSRLPALLDEGRAEAVLASSFDALSTPGRTFAAGVSISTLGEAQSVRLFSRVPPGDVHSLALDASSLTSNGLAQIILAERYGATPRAEPRLPNMHAMLAQFDACVLIGDIGMTAKADGLHVLDLGAEWRELTGLPFVWALWIGTKDLSPELAQLLRRAKDWGLEHLDEIAQEAATRPAWTLEMARDYLGRVMNYDLGEDHLQGLRAFRERLLAHRLIEAVEFPRRVGSQTSS